MGGESLYTLLAKRVVAQVTEGKSDELSENEIVLIGLYLISCIILRCFNTIASINSLSSHSRTQQCYCK